MEDCELDWLLTESRKQEDTQFGVAGQKSRQRLECACLKHRFPFAATRPASPRDSPCPKAKAPVKPDALQTLARATDREACPASCVHVWGSWARQFAFMS